MLDSGSNLSDLKTKRKVDNNKSKFQTTSKGKTINSSFKSSDIKNFGETEGINKPKGFSSTVGSGGLSSGMSYNSNSQMQFSNDESMKSMLKTMLSYKKTNKDLTSTILDTKRSIINYEKLILQLEKELEYYRELNMKIQGDLFVTTQRKITCEQSESQVQDYCRDLKKKFKVVVAAIEKYESQLRQLKQEKEDLINKYDSQLEDLAEEKFNLTNNQEDLKVKISYQKDCLKELDQKLQQTLEEKLKQKIFYDNKDKEDNEKYDILSLKHIELTEKMKEYINEEALEEHENIVTRRVMSEMEKEKDEFML